MNYKNFFLKNKEILQLVYGIVLIITIPTLFIYNSYKIIKEYNINIDAALQNESLAVGRSIYALIQDDLKNKENLQNEISKVSKRNPQIVNLSVLESENDKFKIVASSDPGEVGKPINFSFYKLAWSVPEDNEGIAIDSFKLATTAEDSDQLSSINSDDRYWLVAMPMQDADGNKNSLLTIKLSSEKIDELTRDNRNKSIVLLVISVLIIILFLAIAVRLWDYALLYKKIKEVDQMKDEFISMASHELRTPVTSIRGYTSMVLDGTFGEINEKVKNSLAMVGSSADRLANLVEDLLNVSRIEQGRLKTDNKPTDISGIIKEIVAELKVQADEKKLELALVPQAGKLPLINIDSDRFKQVLINIIGNAIKYTKDGKVEIFTDVKNNGKTLELKVKDTGVGISAKDKQRLFEKFYRVQNDATKNITGTGLGLWITKKIIELMGGEIMIDSIENVGTQVTLSFSTVKK